MRWFYDVRFHLVISDKEKIMAGKLPASKTKKYKLIDIIANVLQVNWLFEKGIIKNNYQEIHRKEIRN